MLVAENAIHSSNSIVEYLLITSLYLFRKQTKTSYHTCNIDDDILLHISFCKVIRNIVIVFFEYTANIPFEYFSKYCFLIRIFAYVSYNILRG